MLNTRCIITDIFIVRNMEIGPIQEEFGSNLPEKLRGQRDGG
jgi:hypothetical protein